MSDTKYCADCGEQINSKAEICPKCGVRQVKKKSTKTIIMVLVILAALGLGATLLVPVIFVAASGREKTRMVPQDAKHLPFYDMIKSGKSRKEVDPLCEECHDGVKVAFPKDHPPKPEGQAMRCLFCHKLRK